MEHNPEPAPNQRARTNYLTVTLVVVGIAAVLLIGMGLILQSDNLKGVGTLVALAYTIVLIWWLARSRPTAEERPDFSPIVTIFTSYWAMLALTSTLAGLVFVLTGVILGNGWLMVPLSTLLAIVMLIVLREHMHRKVVLAGIIVFAVLFLVEFIVQPPNVSGAIINALLIAFQAMAGVVLLTHTQLTTIRLYDGQMRKSLQSLCWGCMLALPPALFNSASLTSSFLTDSDRRFDHWWKAVYALQPALLEETWARLFLLTLFYAVLRPTSRQKPQRALTAALMIAICIHALAHYPQSLSNPLFVLFVPLMYGIPLGLIYIKRDYESALAYHFCIDAVRFAFTASLIN